MRLRYGLLLVVVVALGGALAAAWLAMASLDPVRMRLTLEQAASERLGATVVIDGDVHLALLPRPALQATHVSVLHGAPGDPDALAVTADTLGARLDLSAFWHGRFAAEELVLDGAEVQAPFPFDVRLLTAGRPDGLRSTDISLRRARVRLGGLGAEQVDARLSADRLTGDVTLAGTFRLADGSAWRASLRLSQPGGDGSAALDANVAEIYSADGPIFGASGQLAGDGDFAGRITASGPSLARLVPAPAVPFAANGRLTVGGGVATLEDAALTLDAVPARLDASLRLSPQPRLDLRLAASRLDLDAWRRAVSATPAAAWPTLPATIALTAEAASLGGGTVRGLRAGLSVDGGRVAVRELEAVLPGGMTARADGTIEPAAATARLALRLDGGELATTAAWFGGMAGVRAASRLPEGFRALSGRASLELSGHELEAHDIAATLDGVAWRGDAIVSWPQPGEVSRERVAAILAAERLDGAPWLAWWRDGRAGWPWPDMDASIQFTTKRATAPGLGEASFELDATMRQGALDIRRLRAGAPAWSMEAAGARSADGRWSGVAATLAADHVGAFGPVLPAWWRELLAARPAVAAQPLRVRLEGEGSLAAPDAGLDVDLGDLQAEIVARAEAATGHIQGAVTLRHPSARALGEMWGVPVGFVGEGSLTLSGDGKFQGDLVVADDWRLRAGLLDVGGDLRLDLSRAPALSGRIDAPLLMLPALDLRDPSPLPLWLLRGWSAVLDVQAARVGGIGSDLRTRLSLAAGTLHFDDVSIALGGGGRVTGRLSLASAVAPPLADADLSATGLTLPAQASAPLDLAAAGVAGSARLQAQGFSPAALLATVSGQVQATAETMRLTGIDAGRLGGDLSDAAVRAALAGGETELRSGEMSLALDRALATVRAQAVAAGGAAVGVTGALDLADATVDLDLSVIPAVPAPPVIGLHVSGRAGEALATPDLGGLARWRLAHQ